MKTRYAIPELARATAIPAHELLELAAAEGMVVHDEDGGLQVPREDLPRLFALYFKGREYGLTYRLPGYLEASDAPWCAALRTMYADPVTRPTSLSPQQGEFLRALTVNTNPLTVVEIGAFLGVSSLWIGGALQDAGRGGRLYAIDPFNDILPLPKRTRTKCVIDPMRRVQASLLSAGLEDSVTLLRGYSQEVGAGWPERNTGPIDMLYVDGDHSLEGVVADVQTFGPFMRPGGIVVFHDIFPENCSCDGPRRFLDALREQAPKGRDGGCVFELETSPHNFGMAVVRMPGPWTPRPEVLG